MTDAKRDRLKFLRARLEARPEATRDRFGAAVQGMGDRLDFWLFRLTKRAAAVWDWIMWVAEGPAWTLKRRAKERAIAREAGPQPQPVARHGVIRRSAVRIAWATVLAATLAAVAATIAFTSGPDDDRAAKAGTPVLTTAQPAVSARERAAKAAERAHERRARAHRARIAAQRRHRAAVARAKRLQAARTRAKRLQAARTRARRAAAARRRRAASAGPSPKASTPTTAPRRVAPAPAPVRSTPAPAPAPKPAPKPQAGIVFDNER